MNWEMVRGIYAMVSLGIGALSALWLFGFLWDYGARKYGTWAFILGWIPGGVAAFVGFWTVAFLWPLIAIGVWWWVRREMNRTRA